MWPCGGDTRWDPERQQGGGRAVRSKRFREEVSGGGLDGGQTEEKQKKLGLRPLGQESL